MALQRDISQTLGWRSHCISAGPRVV